MSRAAAIAGPVLGAALLLAPLIALGAAPATLAAALAGGCLFIALPGLALLVRTSWMSGGAFAFATWCAASGLALAPLWLTPLWMANLLPLAWLVPVASLALIAARRAQLAAYVRDATRSGAPALARLGGVCAFASLATCLAAMEPFSHTPLNLHFATQGSIVRNLLDGWPPENHMVEGVPLSYNYGLHLLLMPLVRGGADIVQLVARVAPLLAVEGAILAFLAFGRSVLRLPWLAAMLAAAAAFCGIGFGPVNSGLYGSALPSASVYVVSTPAAFIVFFVALRFLSSPPDGRLLAGAIGAALGFSITAMRGQGAPVWLAVVAFTCVLPLPRERRLDTKALCILAGSAIGVLAGLRIYFTWGSAFSGTSFLRLGTTFAWLAAQGDAFTLVDALRREGLPPWLAGAAGFTVIALMQPKFLAPALVYRLATLRLDSARPLLHLAAAALAGTMATMMSHSPGGSHFSFLHYSTLSMCLLGAHGLTSVTARNAATPSAGKRHLVVALVALLAIPSAWDLALQLRRYEGRWLAGPPALHTLAHVDPLLDLVPRHALLLPLIRVADHPPGIEEEWAMLRGIRFPMYPQLLQEYSGWESALQPRMRQRFAAAAAIEASLVRGVLESDRLGEVRATLSHPEPLYAIVPGDVVVPSDPRTRTLGRTDAYALYRFQPETPAPSPPKR